MNKFLNALTADTNYALTENGALVRATTTSRVLDFFAQGGALRNRGEIGAISLFDKALSEDELLSLKAMFYFRDIRGGQGERDTFRTLLKHLATVRPELVRKNLGFIPHYGRWDDLYTLVGTSLEAEAFELMKMQFDIDMASEKPKSLLGKWLKSENTSSKKSCELGRKTRKAFGMSSRDYRKALSDLRARLAVVERLLSSNEWQGVNYEHLPSNAGKVYRKAFMRHDEVRYRAYIDAVAKGEKKINVKDLFPYEVVREAQKLQWNANDLERKALDVSWKNLPNYFENASDNGIVVADVSGSMSGLPMQISISLAIYCAERNKGPFQNKFITFSGNPTLQTVEGTDIVSKVHNLQQAHWEMNTNIERVFDLILSTAVKHKLSQDELPGKLYIISDMEFDAAASVRGSGRVSGTLFETIRAKFEARGYTMPLLVFWNVNARNDQFPMSMDDRGFQMVSGSSPSIVRYITTGTMLSAYDLMLNVLNSERYSGLVV